jgi:pilus assembly protein CpaB
MRARTLILLLLAVVLAGGTAFLARAWLSAQHSKDVADAAPMALPMPAKSVLVARAEIRRGQILRPDEMVWQTWPEGGLDKTYVVIGGPRTPDSFAGWVARNPIAGGEPINET